jgi:hypothetical protein
MRAVDRILHEIQGAPTSAYQLLADRERQQQRELIKVSEENIELRFEVEQARKDIPRLKVTLPLLLL